MNAAYAAQHPEPEPTGTEIYMKIFLTKDGGVLDRPPLQIPFDPTNIGSEDVTHHSFAQIQLADAQVRHSPIYDPDQQEGFFFIEPDTYLMSYMWNHSDVCTEIQAEQYRALGFPNFTLADRTPCNLSVIIYVVETGDVLFELDQTRDEMPSKLQNVHGSQWSQNVFVTVPVVESTPEPEPEPEPMCDEGYTEVDGICIKIVIPPGTTEIDMTEINERFESLETEVEELESRIGPIEEFFNYLKAFFV